MLMFPYRAKQINEWFDEYENGRFLDSILHYYHENNQIREYLRKNYVPEELHTFGKSIV